MMNVRELDHWHKTKRGLFVFGLVELAIAYVCASWAIDSANLLDYLFTILFTIGALQNLGKLFRSLVDGKKHPAKR